MYLIGKGEWPGVCCFGMPCITVNWKGNLVGLKPDVVCLEYMSLVALYGDHGEL